MLAEARAFAGARHRVPLIANAAGVETQRPRGAGLGLQRRHLRRDETRLLVMGVEHAISEEARLRSAVAGAHRPEHRRHGVERAIGHVRKAANIEIARAVIFEA